MDDSDSDFSDVGETTEEERRDTVNEKGTKVRGEAKAWTELFKFENAKDFSCRKSTEFQYADVM